MSSMYIQAIMCICTSFRPVQGLCFSFFIFYSYCWIGVLCVCPSPHHSCITSLVMVSSIQQHRSAIGSHNNFIKFKESANLWYILTRMQTLLDYYGPIVLLIFMNFPYCYAILVLCLWNVKLNTLKQKATFANVSNDTPTKGVNTCVSFSFRNLLLNIGFCLILLLLLMLCGDVSPNPGPMKFCHLNARSILSGVDLDTHIEDQYS